MGLLDFFFVSISNSQTEVNSKCYLMVIDKKCRMAANFQNQTNRIRRFDIVN